MMFSILALSMVLMAATVTSDDSDNSIVSEASTCPQKTPACPRGWADHEDRNCYKVVSDQHVTYPQAKLACYLLRPSSTLVIIRSKEEQEFVNHLVSNIWKVKFDPIKNAFAGYWLDAIAAGGNFTWIDGSPFTYTNWAPMQPDNPNTTPYLHVVITPNAPLHPYGTWADRVYNALNVAVCQLSNRNLL